MSSDYFLTNANRMIGESARYVRQFQANAQASGNSQTGNTSTSSDLDQMMQSLNPLLLMMVYQMLSQMMTQTGYGLPASSNYPLPVTPTPSPSSGTSSPPTQNPAYTYLNNLLNNGTTTVNTTETATPRNATVDFSDNTSLQDRIDELLDSSQSTDEQEMAYQLKTLDPDSTEAEQLQDQLKARLQADGRSSQDLQELDLLWQGLSANHQIPLLEIQSAGSPSDALSQQINTLKQKCETLQQQWQALQTNSGNTASTTTPLTSDELATNVKTALQNGTFTEAQLGSSLKYMLDQSPTDASDRVATLISDLMESGTLNITPFLSNDYLEMLSPERRQSLLYAVEGSGLRMANGQPNSRFIGYMLENLAKPGDTQTKAFLQQFLQDFYRVHGSNTTTPVGSTLAQILSLAGIQPNDQDELAFP